MVGVDRVLQEGQKRGVDHVLQEVQRKGWVSVTRSPEEGVGESYEKSR